MKQVMTTTALMCTLAFSTGAAPDALAEVVHGKQATANAASDEVKKFGQRMIDDHGKANEELKGLAAKKSVTLPSELDQTHQAMQQKLEKTKGAEFDRAYMQHTVQAHKQAVTLFRNEAKNGKDQEHLTMATEIAGKAGKGK